ncbi:hypothetical protein ScPMuIL_018540 [Solemya velum]
MERRQPLHSASAIFDGSLLWKRNSDWLRCQVELVHGALNIYYGDKHVKCVQLDHNTSFHKVNKKSKEGHFRFDITTKIKNKPEILNFETDKHFLREMWWGYIDGLLNKGEVPGNLDLMDDVIFKIQDDIKRNNRTSDYFSLHSDTERSRISNNSRRSSERGSELSDSTSEGCGSGSSRSGMGESVSTFGGGLTVEHKFYRTDPNSSESQVTPSWFIPRCSREKAEKILDRADPMKHGNTLMRESTQHMNFGSYVISKRYASGGTFRFEHFEVKRTWDGYQINVQNETQTNNCLSDVMEHFRVLSGSDTRFLTTNCLKDFGLDLPLYDTNMILKKKKQVKVDPLPEADYPDYETPHPIKIHTSNTVSPATAGLPVANRLPLYSSENQLSKLQDYDRHIALVTKGKPAPTHHYTASDTKAAAVEIENLDMVISNFDESDNHSGSGEYKNIAAFKVKKDNQRPLPPVPCVDKTRGDDYQSIPDHVAPPPPKPADDVCPKLHVNIPSGVRIGRRQTEPVRVLPFLEQNKIAECVKQTNTTKPVQPKAGFAPSSIPVNKDVNSKMTLGQKKPDFQRPLIAKIYSNLVMIKMHQGDP